MGKKTLKFFLLFFMLLCLMFTLAVPVGARAGGGGSSGGGGGSGSGGGSSSGGGSYHGGGYYGDRYYGGRAYSPLGEILNVIIFGVVVAGGTVVFTVKVIRVRQRSKRLMKEYQKAGINWDYKEIQKYIEHAYFEIQECWRQQDISWGAPYLSKDLQESWSSKFQWMKVRNEKVIQRNVRLLDASPVAVSDDEGESNDRLWYLIHGRMIGYYTDKNTGAVIRGTTRPETFYEYWLFIRENGRWVLHEIRQENEVDIDCL